MRGVVLALLAILMLYAAPVRAQDQAQILTSAEQGFARIVLSFPGRLDLPKYRVKYDNGVLAIEFDEPISILLPDIALALPDYATIARVDPDSRGIRIGLRSTFNINRMDAGEALYIDLLPPNWVGLPPALPPEVIAALAERSKRLAEQAEEERKVEEAKRLKPVATVRVGRNPTFVRLQVDWNVDTKAQFTLKGTQGSARFDWPAALDLTPLNEDLPAEIKRASNKVGKAASTLDVAVAEGVIPRFYQMSPRQFILDIDIAPTDGLKVVLEAEDKANKARLDLEAAAKDQEQRLAARLGLEASHDNAAELYPASRGAVTPVVSTVGNTVRIAFPFDADTPAAVFRRGDVVWMVFDTPQVVANPPSSDALSSIASGFEVVTAGETKVVRMDLAADRLATLGSEGRAWVLSLGDTLLAATEPVALLRERDEQGRFQMSANMERPGKVHVLRDPVVGDTLRVVTALPPARGMTRSLQFVDFDALRSAHGLVIKPRTDELDVELEDKVALISSRTGLTLSEAEASRKLDAGNAPQFRASYLDLNVWRETDPTAFARRKEAAMSSAAAAEGRLRDVARLELAQLYVGNELAYEAIGVLDVLQAELKSDDLRKKAQLVRAIADTLATRPKDALPILNAGTFPDEADALLWRTIARTEVSDYRGARLDAVAAEGIISSYPVWVQTKFLFAATRAAVETKDEQLALRLVAKVDFPKLDPEQVSFYQLMQGRISELGRRDDEALETYGTVIAADFRPTRAEAVYRTLLLLDKGGKIDLSKATETLAAEVLTWRGTALEADMQKLLAQLYFKNHAYREGFITVREAAASFPDSTVIDSLLTDAQATFEDLYLNGAADKLADLDALALFYDFRQLTPPGTRGDEMIRNLTRRLVKVDLLQQAGDLLEYQVDSRLTGVAQAQVATDLALIRIADRHPEEALKVLARTRLADLPPQLERQRRILESRALIDAGRQELALDLISKLEGRDADYLRVDGYWKARNYAQASELLEVLSTPAARTDKMNQDERMSVVKAAVGFVLAGDKLGLSRLRSKFSDQMANSAEWPLFEYVTRDIAPQSVEFRKVAQEIASQDSLNAFIASYRERYGEAAAVTPDKAVAPAA
ncbi:hypothetical protein PRN20_11820 [Devosia sp. ZB163]|uniref:hypothetical protein n=1 Tax=Devosia sp. ZB163 TaxID=3025938 RepID=UPI00235DE872|nr:hypothetical protein [Devosia sp. ZB163]MDC9824421.1 hypothetical protein [Devosia sp. ZB163]